MDNILLTLSLVIFIGFIAQWFAWRIKLPAILPLLAVGILVGPVFNLVNPKQIFGDLLHPMVSLAVAVILFEGSLTLKFAEVRQVGQVVRRLISIGALITGAIVSFAMHYYFEVPLSLAILFGALMTVTGPTVVVPMLRTIRPNSNISNILRWEGILIDPVGALLAVMVFEYIILQSQGNVVGSLVWLFLKLLLVGGLLGIAAGWLLENLLGKRLIPEFLHNVATLSLVLVTFSVANTLAHESGLLAVTLMGIWLANSKRIHITDILNFKENLTIVLVSVLFIVLSAQIDLGQLAVQWWVALGAYLIVQFVARPIGVAISTIGSELNWRERILIAWIGPRGIVAAAISALFALRLETIGYPQAATLITLTFSVIVGTVLIQSLTAKWLGNRLGVTEPESSGFLITDARPLSIQIGLALQTAGVRVLIADTSYSRIHEARMLGLPTFYGNPVSEYADQHLELIGIGKLLALSPRRESNTIACLRYSSEFGRNNVFHIALLSDQNEIAKNQVTKEMRGHLLFGSEVTYQQLSDYLQSGYVFRTTALNEKFTYADYQLINPGAIKLFCLKTSGEVAPFEEQLEITPDGECRIISLVPENKNIDPQSNPKQDD